MPPRCNNKGCSLVQNLWIIKVTKKSITYYHCAINSKLHQWYNSFTKVDCSHHPPPPLVSSSASYRRRQWHPTPILLPGKSHGWRSLAACRPWGREESDTTERLHFHLSLSCIGEGNGNPLQCSGLENPRVGGAWWAAVYGVAQSRTRLKRLSSSSSSSARYILHFKQITYKQNAGRRTDAMTRTLMSFHKCHRGSQFSSHSCGIIEQST